MISVSNLIFTYLYFNFFTAILFHLGASANSTEFSSMVNSDSIRSNFVQQVFEFVLKFKFDGVDIDWEYPSKKK